MSNSDAIARELRTLRAEIAKTMPDNPVLSGWAAYSQCDEDGIIRECLKRIATNTSLSQTFVEIGCADGLENNSHLLLLEGHRGVWVDGSKEKLLKINEALGGVIFQNLWALEAMVSLDTAKPLAERAKGFLGVDSVDFFSLDIDGNDWHVLPSFLKTLTPKLVCVEYNSKCPPPTNLVLRYNENHTWNGDDYFGASLQAWVETMNDHGYSLVCCNLSGANAFFVRNELLTVFSTYTPSELYQPARYHLTEAPKGHAPSLGWIEQTIGEAETDAVRFVTVNALNIPPFKLAIHKTLDQYISGDLARNGVWEPFETEVFSRLCKPNDKILDLGANIGWYSIIAAKILNGSGSIMAFEPDGANARVLEMNAAISDENGTIQIFRNAVADKKTEALFYKSDTNLGDHRLFSDGSAREASSVSVTTLDSIFSDKQQNLPDIVKSDTQGSEAKILKGAADLFSKGWRPVMILEFWPFGLSQSGDAPLELWNTLVNLGYQIFELSEENPVLVPLNRERLIHRLDNDISPSAQGFINLLCIPNGSTRIDSVIDLIK